MIEIRHPNYSQLYYDWIKFRDTYKGGSYFVYKYLERFSLREETEDFNCRKKVTYCPAFAKSAINEIKNSIFQRMVDINRVGGSDSYRKAIRGNIDRRGHDLNTFISTEVLPELLPMGKVGVYVDMPKLNGPTIRDNKSNRPYIYIYRAEQILSWEYDDDNILNSVLLEDVFDNYDASSILPTNTAKQYRHIYKQNGKILVDFYDISDKIINAAPTVLELEQIPLHICEISDSLLTDVADYQIALLNLASSDIGYILKSNFPFYTEQKDARVGPSHLEGGEKEKEVGATHGRFYTGERPGFIHPSSEPLKISMEKQQQLKEEIRLLVHLAVNNIQPVRQASAESKIMDDRSLVSGLSYIGLVLQFMENEVAKIWSQYEGDYVEDDPKTFAVIKYPEKYSLQTTQERVAEAKATSEQIEQIPSLTYKKVMTKKLVDITLGTNTDQDTLAKISTEIDKAVAIVSSTEQINQDVIDGILSPETAASIKCYPDNEAQKAFDAHAKKLEQVAQSQNAIKGVNQTPDTTKGERMDKQTRGEGK